jgi:hypothetical protein
MLSQPVSFESVSGCSRALLLLAPSSDSSPVTPPTVIISSGGMFCHPDWHLLSYDITHAPSSDKTALLLAMSFPWHNRSNVPQSCNVSLLLSDGHTLCLIFLKSLLDLIWPDVQSDGLDYHQGTYNFERIQNAHPPPTLYSSLQVFSGPTAQCLELANSEPPAWGRFDWVWLEIAPECGHVRKTLTKLHCAILVNIHYSPRLCISRLNIHQGQKTLNSVLLRRSASSTPCGPVAQCEWRWSVGGKAVFFCLPQSSSVALT